MQLSCLSRQGPWEYGYPSEQVEDCNVYDGEEEHEEGEDDSEEPLHQTFSKGSSDRSSLKMSIHQKKILDTVGESSHWDCGLEQGDSIWLGIGFDNFRENK